ncbi:MAG: alpha/beta fold hydrolase [Promethearchaeota archaeon]
MCGYKKTLEENYNRIDKIKSKIYSSKIGDIEYLLRGKGPTILISHGISGGIDQGNSLANIFFSSNYRFLLISRFGYLKSPMPKNSSPKLQAKAYKLLLNYLGIEKVIIFANSAGSTSAIQFAIKYPQFCGGLILQAPNAPLDFLPGKPPKFIFKSNFVYWFFLRLFGKRMLSMFVPKAVTEQLSKQEISDIIDNIFFSGLPITGRTDGIIFDNYVSNPSINDNVPFEKIKAPTLILNAKDDPATVIEGARTLSEKISNCMLVEFDSGGHLMINCEQEAKQRIDDFIKEKINLS